MVSCSQHLEREQRRENPKLTETLWGSQFASHFWFLVILFTSAHLQETTNPVLRAVHASSFSLSRWPAPAHSLFHPIANLKQVLALCVPPACHLPTQKRTGDSKNILLDERELRAAPLHDRNQSCKFASWTIFWARTESGQTIFKTYHNLSLGRTLQSKKNSQEIPTKLPPSPARSQLAYREGYKHSEVRKEQRGQVGW